MRVLELAQIMAGPTCGMMLADMGADVIKVEKLPGGDDSRGYREPRVNGVSAPFLMLNRNKRGIAIDLKRPEARDPVAAGEGRRRADRELPPRHAGEARARLRRAAQVNPGLIYCAISGYGRDGPSADTGGFDLIAQGFAGLMSVTGEAGGPPLKNGNSGAPTSMPASSRVSGITAAYVHKLKTGQGQIVDTSLMEAALQQTYWYAAIAFATGVSPGPSGSAHLLTAPYQAFRASDGWINIGGANQANWERIADVLGHPNGATTRGSRRTRRVSRTSPRSSR
jgi:crotonobetainyl-CoA:carnitine CoA-transferase CaiB-like acyl-CoA transferase